MSNKKGEVHFIFYSGRVNEGWKDEAFDWLKALYAKAKKDREKNKEFDEKLSMKLGL